MSFEEDLRASLRREQVPEGFAGRVLARSAAERKVVPIAAWRRPAAWAIAAGLAVAAIVPAGIGEYRRREQARAMEARRELTAALAITRMKLLQTKEKIQRTKRHAL